MQHPDFKHRTMPDRGEYEDFNKIDFYTSIIDKTESIQTLNDMIRMQFEPDGQVMHGDEVNLNLLKQVDQHLADIEAITAWMLNTFDVVPATRGELAEDGADDEIDADKTVADLID